MSAVVLLMVVAYSNDGGAEQGGQTATTAGSPLTTLAQSSSDCADTTELQAAAQAEGSLTLYTVHPEAPTVAAAAEFTAEYGIRVDIVRALPNDLYARMQAEADGGTHVADVLGGEVFALNGDVGLVAGGFVMSLDDSELPTLCTGEYPEAMRRGNTAVSTVAPWGIWVNTQLVPEAEWPEDWEDLADPRWADELILSEPGASGATRQLWGLLYSEYGEEFVRSVAANAAQFVPGGAQVLQALGAGSGMVGLLSTLNLPSAQQSGAPVDIVLPRGPNTGFESVFNQVANAPHPNAARLFLNWLLTEEGSRFLAEQQAGVSAYDVETDLPGNYVDPNTLTDVLTDEQFSEIFGS